MNKLKAGDKVLFIVNNELKTGIINSIMESLERAYVQSDGISLAIDVRRLVPVTETTVETEEEKEPEKIKEITVNENQLIGILAEMSAELLKVDPSLALECTLFGGVLMGRLFGKND